jgi:hypothetical protein
MNRLLLSGCVIAIVNLVAPSVGAQSSPAMLPEPLVNALIGSLDGIGYGGPPQYFVGTLPTGYPASLVPAGPVSVLGGARSGSKIVVLLADSTRRLSTVIQDLVQSSGYLRPPATPGSGFSSASGPYAFFCRDSTTVSVDNVMSGAREVARVMYRVNRGRQCSDLVPPPFIAKALKLPPLKPFPGAQVSSSGGGSGDREVDSRAVATGTALEPAALLAHYAAQLVEAGWKSGEPAIGARVAAQFLEATDDAGKHWQGTIMVSGSSTAMDLAIIMRSR